MSERIAEAVHARITHVDTLLGVLAEENAEKAARRAAIQVLCVFGEFHLRFTL
jgi:hypothetical protein